MLCVGFISEPNKSAEKVACLWQDKIMKLYMSLAANMGFTKSLAYKKD